QPVVVPALGRQLDGQLGHDDERRGDRPGRRLPPGQPALRPVLHDPLLRDAAGVRHAGSEDPVTVRDRLVIVAVLVAAALAGFWFVGLAPKRKEATDLQAQITTERQQLVDAQQKAAAARQAKASYRTDYADVAMLGKAVPKSDALPSLIYQLQTAAHDAR